MKYGERVIGTERLATQGREKRRLSNMGEPGYKGYIVAIPDSVAERFEALLTATGLHPDEALTAILDGALD